MPSLITRVIIALIDPILSMFLTLLGYVWAACVGTSSPANAAGMGEVCLCIGAFDRRSGRLVTLIG